MKIMREEKYYQADDGSEIKREHCLTPNGNPMNGRWVLRDREGNMIDFDQYRHDLMERNGYKHI